MLRFPQVTKCLSVLAFTAALYAPPAIAGDGGASARLFQRLAVFPVYLNTDINAETVAEIVDASEDGKTLVYTDAATENLGFVDISNPRRPEAAGVIPVGGEPTSVAVVGKYALVAVNTSPSFVAPSGRLLAVDIEQQTVVATFDLGGQPDSISVSPDRMYAAVAIENERDEDLGDGSPPQAPAGFLVIVDLAGQPADWSLRHVNLEGYADLFPTDPEPEYVDINDRNQAVVTLQENNHIVLVDLPSGNVVNDFSAGTVDLDQIDTSENDLIELNSSLTMVPREPDGVTWLSDTVFATADEGDLNGGGRGFTIFDIEGGVRYTSGNSLEHLAVRIGHYPEDRSENKGNEPENVEVGAYGRDTFLFVGSERSSVVFVYRVNGGSKRGRNLRGRMQCAAGDVEFLQTLPSGAKPEGLKAIPKRGLFVTASEEDSRADKLRSVITIYGRSAEKPAYPTVESADRLDGTPIPWGALSGLAAAPRQGRTVYTIHDSFYRKSRIYTMDVKQRPAVITGEIVLRDSLGELAAMQPELVNNDNTVNLDPEGIAVRDDGGFWMASEGAGTVGDPKRPVKSLNLLLRVSGSGVIEKVVTLPEAVNARQVRFGFEGVAAVGSGEHETVYVAIQREWAGDPANHVRIGRYEPATGQWAFFYYPIDTPLSDNGGWVGLSELTALGNGDFAVVERDNQAGPDAAIKRIYRFSVAGLEPVEDAGGTPSFPVLSKQLVRDLLPDLKATGGLVLEKIEGLAVLPDGTALVVNDNDGVDDSNGETQLLRLRGVFAPARSCNRAAR